MADGSSYFSMAVHMSFSSECENRTNALCYYVNSMRYSRDLTDISLRRRRRASAIIICSLQENVHVSVCASPCACVASGKL